MANEGQRTFFGQFALAQFAACVTGIVALLIGGRDAVAIVFFAGLVYGFVAYELWLVLLDCESVLCEKEPKYLDAKQGCIALLLPLGAVLAGIAVVSGVLIGRVLYRYDFIRSR